MVDVELWNDGVESSSVARRVDEEERWMTMQEWR